MAPTKHAQSGQERQVDAAPSPIGSRVSSAVNFSPHLTLSLALELDEASASSAAARARNYLAEAFQTRNSRR
jgi:hypothetical protein